jgi:benzoate 4-monooxygenase
MGMAFSRGKHKDCECGSSLTVTSEYYDAFVSIQRGLFNTRDRSEHTRKRKVVSHTFSAKSIGQFEQYIHGNLELFAQKWTTLSENSKESGTGFASLDALNWFNFLAFDIIGDLAFGAPFGMLEQERDFAEIRKTPDATLTTVAAIEVLNRRGEVSGALGCLPQLKPYAKYLPDPFFRKGAKAVENLAGIAIARVTQRLEHPSDRVDLLARLMEGKDVNGEKLGREELTAEALTQLIAGSDTTSNTACALLYWCVRTPGVVEKLHQELDAAIGPGVPNYDQVKDLPYISYVIQETMRIHSTSSLGLPRLVPGVTPEFPNPKPCEILGYSFPPGTVLSVPAYTIHHSKEIWGEDADDFVPERWSEKRLTTKQKESFIPFSFGPRACVGRNVAEMELKCIVATVFRNFEIRDEHQGEMETREGFLRKPLAYNVGIRRRS